MPTLPVRPDDGELLQAIANALVKAKKVVVVTGAGISTNSGIPVSFPPQLELHDPLADQPRISAPSTASTI